MSRFTLTYQLPDPTVAAAVAVEQTIEFPLEAVRDPLVRDEVAGRVEAVDGHTVVISVDERVVNRSLTQLLNVAWGNVSLLPGARLLAVEPPPGMPRPAFGATGLRNLAGVIGRPLLMTAVKPMGLAPPRLAELAGTLAAAGIDVVKDDHGLADQPWATFAARVPRIADAVAAANPRCVYAPSLNGPVAEIPRRIRLARDAGARGVLVLPGISGYPALEAARGHGLPVIAHPAGLGAWSDRVAPELVFGTFPALGGADASVFLAPGGRFPVAWEDADAVVATCGRRRILPVAGGGMTVDRVAELRDRWGDGIGLLIGGDLHRHGDLARQAERFRAASER